MLGVFQKQKWVRPVHSIFQQSPASIMKNQTTSPFTVTQGKVTHLAQSLEFFEVVSPCGCFTLCAPPPGTFNQRFLVVGPIQPVHTPHTVATGGCTSKPASASESPWGDFAMDKEDGWLSTHKDTHLEELQLLHNVSNLASFFK